MKKYISIIAILLGLGSCIYPYDPDIEGTSDEIVVMEGNIVAGGTSTVNFSRVYPIKRDRLYDPVNGIAWIEDDAGNEYQPSSQVPSRSVEIPMENASPEHKYRMKAKVGDKVYYSDWLEPTAPPVIEDVSFGLSQDSTRVEVAVTVNGGERGTGFIGISFDETWEFHSDFLCQYYLDTLDWSVSPLMGMYPNYWCWKSSSSGMILMSYAELTTTRLESRVVHTFGRASDRNQKLYSINVHAVNLSEDAFFYISNVGRISEMSGSLFSPNPGEMPSNFRCETDPNQHVEGYVTASIATSFRAFMGGEYYTYPSPSLSSLLIPEDEESYRSLYDTGFYPVDRMTLPAVEPGETVTGIAWGPIRCIDCVVAGGSNKKPDYWP